MDRNLNQSERINQVFSAFDEEVKSEGLGLSNNIDFFKEGLQVFKDLGLGCASSFQAVWSTRNIKNISLDDQVAAQSTEILKSTFNNFGNDYSSYDVGIGGAAMHGAHH